MVEYNWMKLIQKKLIAQSTRLSQSLFYIIRERKQFKNESKRSVSFIPEQRRILN
jgi:hypothetical protein